ncbi:MAG: choice-of-anchor I family protein [Bacteroidota bacterium]
MQIFTIRRGLLCMLLFLFLGSLEAQIQLSVLGTYQSGIFDDGAAEISAYDPISRQLFVTNSGQNTLDVFNLTNPAVPVLAYTIDLSPYGGGPNSVAVKQHVVAVAIEADVKQDPGSVVFFDPFGNFINELTVGALPDMLTFTPNGKYLLVANEGEPDDDYLVDPEGSVSIIRMRNNVANMNQNNIRTVSFTAYNGAVLDPSLRVFGPNATAAQDFEPEYIAVADNSKVAWVVLQENNGMARIRIRPAKVKRLFGLGFKDYMHPNNKLDASNRDNAINITNWPAYGMYQPDAIAYHYDGCRRLILTANEGDARDYDGFSEEERAKDLTLDPTAFPNASVLQEDENLGRINVTNTLGDTDNDGDFDEIYTYGARSFSIRNGRGKLIYDSGDEFEQLTAAFLPNEFNSTDDENGSFDNRSDDKGPEPEGIVVGHVNGTPYAFIGLERIGGIMVYDISNVHAPAFVQYINNRDFTGDAEQGTAKDLSPEGLVFIPAHQSPNGAPILVVSNEVSGSVTLYSIANTISGANNRQANPERLTEVNLGQSFPNPFVERTSIPLQLEEAMPVRLQIYNLNGQMVRSLIDGNMKPGEHQIEWDGTNANGELLPSGIYFYRLEAANNLIVRKMVLTR